MICFDSIENYNDIYGYPTVNKDISVIDTHNAKNRISNTDFVYKVYAIFLKTGGLCSVLYGRKQFDYQKGTIVFFSPGTQISIQNTNPENLPHAKGIVFSEEFIKDTDLEADIANYHFLKYLPSEALHLDDNEFELLENLLQNINSLVSENLSLKAKNEIIMLIKEFLDKCNDFYNRQFSTRQRYHHDIALKFRQLLDEYISSKRTLSEGLPTVSYFAQQVYLSSGYFGDLIKKELGVSAQEIIQNKIADKAKEYLKESDYTITEIAELLGFQYPQHFTRMFKNFTGISPKEYRSNCLKK